MGRLIKKIYDGSIVEFDTGSFDDWCVYLTVPGENRFAPTDVEYFKALVEFGGIHGHQKIYDDFVIVYDQTTSRIEDKVTSLITEIAKGYGEERIWMDRWLTVIYSGMVAEENKENTKLGKRIKRLGVHQCLIEKLEVIIAANFSKGRKWRELDVIMKERGF